MMSRNTGVYTIGIDEAGRGPLAGPVVVAGVKISVNGNARVAKLLNGIRDSKKLSPKKREEWFSFLTSHPKIEWAVARVWPAMTDRINIARAADLGAARVYTKLCAELSSAQSLAERPVLLDAGLRLPSGVPQQAIIKGDEKIPAIAAASIIAKVTRDRLMLRLHKKYPQYRFDLHKGYGTRMHREIIGKIGYSEIHRASFRVKLAAV